MEVRKRGWKEKIGAELQIALPLKGRWLLRFFVGLSVFGFACLLILPRLGRQADGSAGSSITWEFSKYELQLDLVRNGKPTFRLTLIAPESAR